jgi:hypothetical protein
MVINQRMEDTTVVFKPKTCKNEQKEDLVELAMTTFAAVSDGRSGADHSNYLVEALPN